MCYRLSITLSFTSRIRYIIKRGTRAWICVAVPQHGPLHFTLGLECLSLAKLDLYFLRYGLWMIFKVTALGWCVVLALNLDGKISPGTKAWHHRKLILTFGDHILQPNRAPPERHEIVQHNKPSKWSLGIFSWDSLLSGTTSTWTKLAFCLGPCAPCPHK